jgi:hypothetical protein
VLERERERERKRDEREGIHQYLSHKKRGKRRRRIDNVACFYPM